MEDLDRMKKRHAENKVTLNEKARRAELDQDKARKEQRTVDRQKLKTPERKIYTVTLDNVTKPELQLVANDKKPSSDAAEGSPAKPVEPELKEGAATFPVEGLEDEDEEDPVAGKNGIDPVKSETLNILSDLVELRRSTKATTASTAAPIK